jgi:alpha-galactosidase
MNLKPCRSLVIKLAHLPAIAFVGLLAVASVGSAADPAFWSWAKTPPMGWNSWDCFGAGVWETNVLANADYMDKNLKSHGWNVITIDIQWYEPLAHTTEYRRGAILEMDANGRLLPAPNRFPMTEDSRSFKPIADYLHAKGLKFGLHLLRGIPRQAINQNVPILGTSVHAADVADTNSLCRWNTDMYGVDMTKPGAQAYYDSVFALLASWDLDFVKVDDLSSPYHPAEIEAIRKAIDKTGRPIVFSTSPGATPVNQGEHIQLNANMWRISGDFWDSWPALFAQFARLNSWTPYRGPGHFPDADMLPLGNLRAWQETNNWTAFTRDEQYTLMTLWAVARSPLILGANLPQNDEFTLSLLTNDEVIAVNQSSANNRQIFAATNNTQFVWSADVPGSRDKYLAIFNASPVPVGGRGRGRGGPGTNAPVVVDPAATQPASISVSLADIGLNGSCKVRDLWTHKDLGAVTQEISATVNSHGAVLLRVQPGN